MTNWLRRMGIYFWVILLLVCAVRAVSAAIKSTFLSSRIVHYLDHHPEADTIRLSDFTHRQWDSVLIYSYRTNRAELAEVLGMTKEEVDTKLAFRHLGQWYYSGFALIKDGKIVYWEVYTPNIFEHSTDYTFRPYPDVNSPPFSRILTKEEAVFTVGRSEHSYGVTYSLAPVYPDPDAPEGQQISPSDGE